MENKNRYDDLSSLFLPDILTSIPNSTPQKSEINESGNFDRSQLGNPSITDFNTFINNNGFITSKNDFNDNLVQLKSTEEHHHYNSYMNEPPHHNHNQTLYSNSSSNLFGNSNLPPQHLNKPIESPWFNNPNPDLEMKFDRTPNMNNPQLMNETLENPNYSNLHQLQQIQQLINQLPPNSLNTLSSLNPNLNLNINSFNPGNNLNHQIQLPMMLPSSQLLPQESPMTSPPNDKKTKKVRKARNKLKSDNGIIVDYNPEKLTRLLDFKLRKLNDNFKIFDKHGNAIGLEFTGFLNGRFLTNDVDNSNYIYSLLDSKNDSKINNSKIIKTDAKVLSCYRRNYIQILMDFKLSGFKNYEPNEAKILKLETNEYNYTTTKIIKWFKIEITAFSNISKSQNIALIIDEDTKDKDKDTHEKNHISPQNITSTEHVITLNRLEMINEEIDNFLSLRKLQFKNATPNNGNFTFQNYYHLKIKLSAVTADMYFDDDYGDFEATNDGNLRNEINLLELVSEPIIVRGRNPSFYAERKDLLVKCRSPTSKESYELSMSPLESEEIKFEEKPKDPIESDDYKPIQPPLQSSESAESVTPAKSPTPLNLPANPSPLIANLGSKNLNIDEDSNYKYFPISNVYYLPPINVVYFPHGAHQHSSKPKQATIEDVNVSRRKSSNVYFK